MWHSTILAAALVALAPAAASAGTIAYDGDTLVLTAGPGEANSITFGGEQEGRLSIADAASYAFPAERCTQTDAQYAIQCDLPAHIRADLGDGDDRVVVDHMVQGNPVVEVLGGTGADELKAIGANTRLTLDGGAGADVLRSEGGVRRPARGRRRRRADRRLRRRHPRGRRWRRHAERRRVRRAGARRLGRWRRLRHADHRGDCGPGWIAAPSG